MTLYNATIVARTRIDADTLVEELTGYSPAVSPRTGGRLEVVVSLPAESLRQAITSALAVVEHAAQGAAESVEVMTSDAFDARLELAPMPQLLSVSEAAGLLGVSRQAVLQRLESGSLAGRKVGTGWVIQRASVAAAAR